MAINSTDDWWDLCSEHWPQLLDIFSQFLDMRHPAHTKPGKTDTPVLVINGRTLSQLDDIERSKTFRDHDRLLRYLHAAWFLAPDDPSIRSIPSWFVLCDLCSEDWVFATEDGVCDE